MNAVTTATLSGSDSDEDRDNKDKDKDSGSESEGDRDSDSDGSEVHVSGSDSDSDSDSDKQQQQHGVDDSHSSLGSGGDSAADKEEEEEEEDDDDDDAAAPPALPAVIEARPEDRVLSKRALTAFDKKEKRKGIVYMSRVPPFMKPAKLRHMLSQYGEVGRIFLKPEGVSSPVSLPLCLSVPVSLCPCVPVFLCSCVPVSLCPCPCLSPSLPLPLSSPSLSYPPPLYLLHALTPPFAVCRQRRPPPPRQIWRQQKNQIHGRVD